MSRIRAQSLRVDEVLRSLRDTSSHQFDVSSFVRLCRRTYELSSLSEVLRTYGNTLKVELSELVNRDIDEFVAVVTKLEGIEYSTRQISAPLHVVERELERNVELIEKISSRIESQYKLRKANEVYRAQLMCAVKAVNAEKKLRILLEKKEQQNTECNAVDPTQRVGVLDERIAQALVTYKQLTKYYLTSKNEPRNEDIEFPLTHELEMKVISTLRKSLLKIGSNMNEDEDCIQYVLRAFTCCSSSHIAIDIVRNEIVSPFVAEKFRRVDSNSITLSRAMFDILAFVESNVVPLERKSSISFISSSVWPELKSALLHRSTMVFSAGMPDTFHIHFSLLHECLNNLQSFSSRHFLDDESVLKFMRKFNKGVYFELRFQHIVVKFERALISNDDDDDDGIDDDDDDGNDDDDDDDDGLTQDKSQPLSSLLSQRLSSIHTRAAFQSLMYCLSSTVFLSCMARKFLILIARIIKRLCVACNSYTSSPVHLLSLSIDLSVLASLIQLHVCKRAIKVIAKDSENSHNQHLLHTFLTAFFINISNELNEPRQNLLSRAIHNVSELCCLPLQAVPRIKSTYRMTGRQAPTGPLEYVHLVMSPLLKVLTQPKLQLDESNASKWRYEFIVRIMNIVCETYTHAVCELLRVVRDTEASLRRLGANSNASAFADSSSKIVLQLRLDTNAMRSAFIDIVADNQEVDKAFSALITLTILAKMKNEFEYWYPIDLRVSGKDLIRNHLTMAIYNHAAIWPSDPSKWPQAYFTNGYALLNGQKMSKSTGNFITIDGACEIYGSDAVRLALADAGDGLEDANVALTTTADKAILRLTKELDFFLLILDEIKKSDDSKDLRSGNSDFLLLDRIFANEINIAISKSDTSFSNMMFRDAVKYGMFELSNARDRYRACCHSTGMHSDLILRYIKIWILLISPICPHFAEHSWSLIGESGLVVDQRWPSADIIDSNLTIMSSFLDQVHHLVCVKYNLCLKPKKDKKKKSVNLKTLPTSVVFSVARNYPEWHISTIAIISALFETDPASITDKAVVMKALKSSDTLQPFLKAASALAFNLVHEIGVQGVAAFNISLPFDEAVFIRQNVTILMRDLPFTDYSIEVIDSAIGFLPGKPSVRFVTD